MRRSRILGLLLAALAIAVVIDTFASSAWTERARVHQDLATLRADNEKSERRATELRSAIDGMNTDAKFQERAVRHDLGFIRADDMVLDVGDSRR